MRLVAAVAASALLLGCRTEAAFREKANARVGLDVNDVLSELGPPSREYVMPNGHRLLTWNRAGPTVAYYDRNIAVASSKYCSLTYEVDEGGRVVGGRYEGRCKS